MSLAAVCNQLENEVVTEHVNNYERWHGKVSDEIQPVLIEMVQQNLRFLGNHPYQFSQKVFEKYLQYREILSAHANRPNPVPLVGDRVFIRSVKGNTYERAVFTGRSETSQLCVCTQPYEPHMFNLPEVGQDIPMSVSGGYFQTIDNQSIDLEKGPDRVWVRYWTWASLAQANGGIYIPVQMLRWHLKDGTHDFY